MDIDDDVTYSELDFTIQSKHPFATNLWYQSLKSKVRRLTKRSCYACSLLPKSVQESFSLMARPLEGPAGLPSLCILAYQYAIQTHPKTGTHELSTSSFRPVIRTESLYLGKTGISAMKIHNFMYKATRYAIYSNLSISQGMGQDQSVLHVTNFQILDQYPSLIECPLFYKKYLYYIPVDLSLTQSKSSAMINSSAMYDVCIEGRPMITKQGQDVESLKIDQCKVMIDNASDYASLTAMGISNTPGFYWCCGNNVWDSLPPAFIGRCALCTLNDIIYVVEPTTFLSNHTSASRVKRQTSEVTGYVHLKNVNKEDLSAQYYALPNDHRIYSHSQLVFKSMFWNTELQYANHYLIALTRHDLSLVVNATNLGFRG